MVQTNKLRRGFTLVELLVVIGVIAVLISLLLPTLAIARKRAQETVCKSNLHQWGAAFITYAGDNRDFLPIDGPDGSTTANVIGSANGVTGLSDPKLWYNAIPPLMGQPTYYQQITNDRLNNGKLATVGDNNS